MKRKLELEIEERKRAEDAAKAERQRFFDVFETIPAYLVLLTPDYHVAYDNRFFRERFGEHKGRRCYEYLFNRTEPCEICDTYSVLKTMKPHEWEWTGPDGRNYYIHDFPFTDVDGSTLILEMGIDITGQKKIERKLREGERRLKVAEQMALMGHWELDLTSNTLHWSDEVYRIFDLNPQEFGASYGAFIDTVHPDDRELVNNAYTDSVKDKTAYDIVHRLLMKDGRVKHVQERCSTDYDGQGNPLRSFGTVMDITGRVLAEEEKKKLEEQLRQSQKMEALGLLAGGIAHDFNNRLAAIMNFGHLALLKSAKDDPVTGYIEQMMKSVESASSLTNGLLAFSRKEADSCRSPVKLADLMGGMYKLLKRIIGDDIELSDETADTSLIVTADRGQLENVLINLAANARDAMPGGGRLTLEANPLRIDGEFIKAHGYGAAGDYALISVSDTGKGIAEGARQRIFEPFFTTKEAGKGTGLGLSIVYGIIKQHGGFIQCYSETGVGTTFRIYLPLSAQGAEENSAVSPPYEVGKGETVLLAEDDPEVRAGTKALLEESGYKVIDAADGREAVEMFARSADDIALAILDVIMPGLNGREALDQMRAISPGLRALFVSGYSANHLRKEIFPAGAVHLNKPVMPGEFLRKIREMLGG